MVQWLGLYMSNTGNMGLMLGWGTKIPHAAMWGQKKKRKEQKKNARVERKQDQQKGDKVKAE